MSKASDLFYINELGLKNEYLGGFSPILFYEYICPPVECEECGKRSPGRAKRVFEKPGSHWPDQEDLWKTPFSVADYESTFAESHELALSPFNYHACPGSEWGQAYLFLRESDMDLNIFSPNSQMNRRTIVSKKMRDDLLEWGIKGVTFHPVNSIVIKEEDFDEDAMLREFWMNKYLYSGAECLKERFYELELETTVHCQVAANVECGECGLYSNDYSEVILEEDLLNYNGEDIVRCSGFARDLISKRLYRLLIEEIETLDLTPFDIKLSPFIGKRRLSA